MVESLWGEAPARAEIRRLVHWFEYKFSREVGAPLLSERVIKRFSGEGCDERGGGTTLLNVE